MGVIAALDQIERGAERLTERRGIVANNGQAATALGPIGGGCPDDDLAARAHGRRYTFGTGRAILRIGQEMPSPKGRGP